MNSYRIFVEKKTGFQVEAESLRNERNENLQLHIRELRLFNVYDLFGFTPALLESLQKKITKRQSRPVIFGGEDGISNNRK